MLELVLDLKLAGTFNLQAPDIDFLRWLDMHSLWQKTFINFYLSLKSKLRNELVFNA